MEQLVARRAHNPKVTGSSPVPATLRSGSYIKLWLPFCFLCGLSDTPLNYLSLFGLSQCFFQSVNLEGLMR